MTVISRLGHQEILADSLVAACLVLAWFAPQFGDHFLTSIEHFGRRLAWRKNLCVALIAMAAIAIRVSSLPFLPIPVPVMQDEFCYLLSADTFIHGRLVNPAHPLWIFFDTIHVNQHPVYMSKFLAGQGAVLAFGQLLGHPWIGVLLSVAAMCSAVLWALQGWLPSRWALLGGIVLLFRLGVSSYWINSYWGGAVPAIGGALIVGALPRLLRRWRVSDALFMGGGAAILMNSRPFEGLILCVPVAVAILIQLFRTTRPSWQIAIPHFVLPFGLVALASLAFLGYFNWRGTGNPFLLPELLNERTYSLAPNFLWQKLPPEQIYANPQLEAFYNGWSRDYWMDNRVNSIPRAAKHAAMIVAKFSYFFLWPEPLVVLLALPWVLRDRRTRFLVIQAFVFFAGIFCVIWFLPHYAAPLTATVFVLLLQSLRHLRRWKFHGRLVGIGISRVLVTSIVVLSPFHARFGTLQDQNGPPPRILYRAQFLKQLNSLSGDQLVIVRYGAPTGDDSEWVYNGADLDHAKVIWAREIPGVDIRPLLDYFRNRYVWIAEPEAYPPRLFPLSASNPP